MAPFALKELTGRRRDGNLHWLQCILASVLLWERPALWVRGAPERASTSDGTGGGHFRKAVQRTGPVMGT